MMPGGRSALRRIVFLDSFPRMGGAERSLVELLAHIDRRRFAPYFVTSEEGELSREVDRLGIPVRLCPMPEKVSAVSRTALDLYSLRRVPFFLLGYLRRLAGTIRKLRPHATYSNSLKDHIALSLLSPLLRRPVIWHFRDLIEKRGLRTLVEAVALATPTHLIANSKFTARQFPRLSRRKGRSAVVYNGVNLAEIDRERKVRPAADTTPRREGPVIALVGALCPEKGQEILLHAMALAAEKAPGISCWIIGDEMYSTSRHREGFRGGLDELAGQLGIADRVHFLGWRSDVISLIEKVDVMVNVTDPGLSTETFGRTLVEAMACGKPVIGFARGGPTETVLHGVTGLLFDTYTPEALARAVLGLVGDEPRMHRMGRAGRGRVEELFTMEKYVHGVEARLDEILAG